MEDVNDNPPAFTSFPIRKTVNVRNDKKIGSEIAKVRAADADGTQPGNVVKYKVEARSNKAADYFGIDPNTGVITLLGDLTMEVYDEYKLEVLAHDMGEEKWNFFKPGERVPDPEFQMRASKIRLLFA